MRKEILYFDMEKIDRNNEPLCESEQEVAQHARFDPKPGLYLRLDLEAALKRLPPRQRQAVELTAEGYTECEIAQALGISQPAVTKLLGKARASLKKILRGAYKTAPKCP
jgi:RNA polymerase sigma factor (sigma-70 family)